MSATGVSRGAMLERAIAEAVALVKNMASVVERWQKQRISVAVLSEFGRPHYFTLNGVQGEDKRREFDDYALLSARIAYYKGLHGQEVSLERLHNLFEASIHDDCFSGVSSVDGSVAIGVFGLLGPLESNFLAKIILCAYETEVKRHDT